MLLSWHGFGTRTNSRLEWLDDSLAYAAPVPTRRDAGLETERVKHIYERMAAGYDRQLDWVDGFMFRDGRAWVCSQAHGDVLEVAIGTGRNLPLYPADARLTGVDLSPAMLELARRRGAVLGREVDLRLGDAQALPFRDATFDAVVSTLAFSTIPDPDKAAAEARRVLRPGGLLLVLDHVRSPIRAVRLIQRLLDPILVRFQGDHVLREPLEPLTAAGFRIEVAERARWGIVECIAARALAG